MTDLTSDARDQRDDDGARAAIEQRSWSVKVALVTLVVLVVGLAVVGLVVDLTWQ